MGKPFGRTFNGDVVRAAGPDSPAQGRGRPLRIMPSFVRLVRDQWAAALQRSADPHLTADEPRDRRRNGPPR